MYLYDYQTIKFEHQERINSAAMARRVNGLARDARASRFSGYRTAIAHTATSFANRWRSSQKLTLPGVTGSHA